MSNNLPNQYYLGEYSPHINRVQPALIIKRKPSEIPYGIDSELRHTCGITFMDGPNSKVYYEYRSPEMLAKMEKFLQDCGWVKEN